MATINGTWREDTPNGTVEPDEGSDDAYGGSCNGANTLAEEDFEYDQSIRGEFCSGSAASRRTGQRERVRDDVDVD